MPNSTRLVLRVLAGVLALVASLALPVALLDARPSAETIRS
jgi:hypothetical protein